MGGISGLGASSYPNLASYLTGQDAAGSSADLAEVLQANDASNPTAGVAQPTVPALDAGQLSADQGLAVYLQAANSAAQNLVDQVQNGSFEGVTATSSQAGIQVSASHAASRISYQVAVSAVAQGQQLESDNLPVGAAPIGPGVYSFEITSGANSLGATSTPVTLNVGPGATAQTLLSQLAQAINSSGTGSTAGLAMDGQGRVRLSLSNNLQGQGATVSVRDTSGTLMTRLGLTTAGLATSTSGGTSQDARSAAYSVDGIGYTSDENAATLDGGNVRLSFTQLTTGTATVAVDHDLPAFAGAVSSFVTAYNDAAGFAQSAGSPYSASLLAQLQQSAEPFKQAFGAAGLAFKADGSLTLDQGSLAGALSGRPEGMQALAAALGSFSSQALGSLRTQSSLGVSQYFAELQQAQTSSDTMLMNAYGGSPDQPWSTLSTYA